MPSSWTRSNTSPSRRRSVTLTLPPAVLNYVFAEKYRQEPERVASIVMLGNLGSIAIVPITLAIVLR